jgi:hypothetical protein
MKKNLLYLFLLVCFVISKPLNGQTVIASWSFDALIAPTATVPTVSEISADFGTLSASATAYLDGTNGSSVWSSTTTNPELTTFSGNVLNDPRATPAAGNALALANMSANGKYVVFKFSTLGYSDISATFATRGTATGFNTHVWEWSTDNVTYTSFLTNTANNTTTWSTEVVDLSGISAVNNISTVYLRLTVTGASAATGNNRIDNFVIKSTPPDTQAPVATFVPADAATDVATDVAPTITFDEAILNTDASEITNANVSSLITFKTTDASGTDVAFTATIDNTKKIITVTPSANLSNETKYYLAVNKVEDASGNESAATSSAFTTIASTTPSLTLTAPVGGETYYAGDAVTITWTTKNVTNVMVEAYVVDNGSYAWTTLSASVAASEGKLDVTIPAVSSYGTGYKIRISDVDNPTYTAESAAFTIYGVATSISDLKSRFVVGDYVKISSEVVVNFKTSAKNIYVQDAGAGILIYDSGTKITATYAIGDGITGLTGKIATYNGMLEIVPTIDPGTASSTGNTLTPVVLTAATLNSGHEDYESMLIKLNEVTFGATGTFTSAQTIVLTDASGTTNLYVNAAVTDLIGTTIPNKADVVGVCMEYTPSTTATIEIVPRSINDLTAYSSSAKAITAFAFNGLSPVVTGTIDETAKTIAATVPAGTSRTALVPTITVSANASVSPASGVATDFSSAVTYTVTAQDGTTQTYTVTVSVASGIDEQTEANVKLYPVPATTDLYIENVEAVKQIDIFNVAGAMVSTSIHDNENLIHVYLDSYTSGIYFIRFTTADGTFMKKFIKK